MQTMKRIILILCASILIIGLWSGAWLFIADQIDKSIASAATPADPAAPQISCAETAITGFPFRFDTRCTNAKIANGDIAISIAEVRVSVLAYKPTHYLAFVQSPAKITDAFYGTEQEFRWDSLEASLRTYGWQLSRVSVQAENLSLHDTLLADTVLGRANRAEAHLLNIKEQHDAENGLASLALYAKSDTTDLPFLNVTEGHLRLEAEVSNLPDDIRNWATPNALRNWQQAGGALNLVNLNARDATANVDLTGDLSLNAAGEVSGIIQGTSDQVAERFADFFQPQYQSLVFGVRQPDGTYKQTITLARGAIFAGITPLGALPAFF